MAVAGSLLPSTQLVHIFLDKQERGPAPPPARHVPWPGAAVIHPRGWRKYDLKNFDRQARESRRLSRGRSRRYLLKCQAENNELSMPI